MTMQVTITLKKSSTKPLIMKWIRDLYFSRDHRISIPEVAVIARALADGLAWTPVLVADHLFYAPDKIPDFIKAVFVMPPNPYEEAWAEIEKQRQLLERGAAGHASAAIEYCKLELAGKVSHVAFAG